MNLINKKNSAIAIIAILVLSWSGIANKYSQRHIDDSIKNTAIVYATARGINAVVSILQSSELSISFIGGITITAGEILDPINDSIERFSEVVSIALGSLVLQKILANIVSQNLFNWMITIFAIGLIISLYFKRQYINFTSKGFALLIFTKFLFIAVIALNAGASFYFLNNNIDKNHEKLEKFQDGMSIYTGQLTTDEKNELSKQNETSKQEILDNKQTIKRLNSHNNAIKKNKKAEETKKDAFLTQNGKGCNWWWFGNKKCNAIDVETNKINSEITKIDTNIDSNKRKIKTAKTEIQQARKTIKSNKEQISNKFEPSLWQKVQGFSIDISDETVEKYIANLFNLIVLFILKTILLPLGFFFLLVKGLKRIWRLNWFDYLKD